MRVLPTVIAVLVVGLSATFAIAEPRASQPASRSAAEVQVSDQAFREARAEFTRQMGDMNFAFGQTRNLNETRAVVDRYQPEADAFAELIEARLAAGEATGHRYRNARSIRDLPQQTRRAVDRSRWAGRGNGVPVATARRGSEFRTAEILAGRAPVRIGGAI